MKKKVYLIDYDLISPLGCGKAKVFDSLTKNYAAESNISRFDTTGIPFSIAAEIKEDLSRYYRHESGQIISCLRYDRKFELAVSAAADLNENSVFVAETGTLDIQQVKALGTYYKVKLRHIGDNKFELIEANEITGIK